VKRMPYLCAALLVGAVLVGPAGAQSDMPTELWSEYPVVQKVQRTQQTEQTSIGPLLPPTNPDAAPVPSETTRWSLWLPVVAVGLLVVLFAARTAVPVATSGIRTVAGGTRRVRGVATRRPRVRRTRPIQLREAPPRTRAPARRRGTQYAPLPPVAVAEPDVEREARHYVARRTGFLRSRFVVVADEPGGKMTHLRASRSFWRVGGDARREGAADDAWNDLVNDLRATGWEPASAQPSDFYVLLRPVDTSPSSIVPTLEAYTHDEVRDGS
jgi:hypothetical protein